MGFSDVLTNGLQGALNAISCCGKKVTPPVKLGVLPMRAKPSVPRVTRKRVIRFASRAGIVTCRPLFFVEYFSSVFQRKHYVIFAIPLRMR